MAVMAEWCSKKWLVSPQKVLALEGLSFSYAKKEDDNSSDKKKKTTGNRSTELITLSFTTVLHSGAGVDVRAEIESWKKLVTQTGTFTLGGKTFSGVFFELKKVSVSNVKLDDLGRMRLATLTFEFLECEIPIITIPPGSALIVKASTAAKAQKKTTNKAVKKAATKTIKVGSYVKPTGKKYATGEKIPTWVKQRSHKVSQIKGNKVLLGHPNGINSWVYKNEVTLV